MKKFALAVALTMTTASPALAATTITSIQVKNANGIPGQGYLQIAELQLFSGAINVALSGTASASTTYVNGPAIAAKVKDNDTTGFYPNIYHGDASDGSDILTLTVPASSITRISIFGRNPTDSGGCCSFRDRYSYTLFNGSTVVGGGNLDARGSGFATVAVPEPATWAMMLLGFGMVGLGLRSRRAGKVATRVAFG